MKKIFTGAMLSLMIFHGVNAQKFVEGNWLYEVSSNVDLTVKVIGRTPNGTYLWPSITNIPSEVVHNGISFTVASIGRKAIYWQSYGTNSANGYYAENYGHSITTLNIPSTITNIEDSAFFGCTNLANITFNTTIPPVFGADVFKDVPLYAFIHIPCGATMNYANLIQLNQFSHFVEEGMYGTVSLQQTTGGTITMTQEPTCSTPAIIEATPATTYSFPAYDFVSWSDGDTNNPRTLYVTGDTVISAIFTPRQFYNIAEVFDSTQGYAIGDTAFYGDTATFTAYPYHGYTFSAWKAFNSSTNQWFTFSNDNPYRRVMDYSLRLRAVFTTAQYTVTVQSSGGGSVSVGSSGNNTGSFNYLSSAYIYATPSTGYRFVMWSDSLEFASRYITVRSDTTLTAIFASIESLRDTIYDTVYVHDTTIVYQTDTVFVHDTIYIHDTIVVGVEEVDAICAKIYTSHGQIVVDGAESNTVWMYDVNGRILATKQDEHSPLHFDVPASGTYLIKIGNHPARKVVVIR